MNLRINKRIFLLWPFRLYGKHHKRWNDSDQILMIAEYSIALFGQRERSYYRYMEAPKETGWGHKGNMVQYQMNWTRVGKLKFEYPWTLPPSVSASHLVPSVEKWGSWIRKPIWSLPALTWSSYHGSLTEGRLALLV